MLNYIILSVLALYALHLLYCCLKSLFKTIKPWLTIAFARQALHTIKSMYIPLLVIVISVCAIIYFAPPVIFYSDETGFSDILTTSYEFIDENPELFELLSFALPLIYFLVHHFSQKNKN
jgi:hypothetical protein